MKRDVARVTLITLVGVSIIFALWLTTGSAKNQQPDRIVVNKHWPTEPLKIVNVKTKHKLDLELGKPFIEDEDWVDGFTVKVLNSYYKTVTTATISMVFSREPGDTRHPLAFNLHFGPSAFTREYKDRDPNKVIKARNVAQLGLSPEDYLL